MLEVESFWLATLVSSPTQAKVFPAFPTILLGPMLNNAYYQIKVSCFPCGAWGAAHSHFMRVWIVLGWTLNCRVSYRAVEYCSCPHLLYQKYHCYKFWFGFLYSFLYHFDPARQGYFKGIPTIDPILQTLQTYKIILKAYIRHISEPQILYEVCVQWDTLINSPK